MIFPFLAGSLVIMMISGCILYCRIFINVDNGLEFKKLFASFDFGWLTNYKKANSYFGGG